MHYHKVWQGVDKLADFFQGRSFVHELGPVTIQHDFLQMFQVSVVNQCSQVGPVRRGDWTEKEGLLCLEIRLLRYTKTCYRTGMQQCDCVHVRV